MTKLQEAASLTRSFYCLSAALTFADVLVKQLGKASVETEMLAKSAVTKEENRLVVYTQNSIEQLQSHFMDQVNEGLLITNSETTPQSEMINGMLLITNGIEEKIAHAEENNVKTTFIEQARKILTELVTVLTNALNEFLTAIKSFFSTKPKQQDIKDSILMIKDVNHVCCVCGTHDSTEKLSCKSHIKSIT